jgi:zinc transporter, ZIP family
MIEAIAYSALSGMSTLLGVILVLKYGSLSRRGIAFSLGMSVGVMLVVSLGSLLSTAIRYGTWAHVVLGMSAGLLLIILLHHIERPDGEHGDRSSYARLGLLLVLAVAAHNAPEGVAIGIGFHTEHKLGVLLALSMAVHNVPEGIGMAAPLKVSGHSPLRILLFAAAAGGMLPLGTWIGGAFLAGKPDVVSAGLVFATTTILWVATREVGPRAWDMDRGAAMAGALLGMLFMYIIETVHG